MTAPPRTLLLPPSLPALSPASLTHDDRISEAALAELELPDQRAHRATLRECTMMRCRLDGLRRVESLRGVALDRASILEFAELWAQAVGIDVLPGGETAER